MINAIVGFGIACRNFLDDTLTGLTLTHCEVDEMWTFVQKKQARLMVEEKQTRHDIGDMYLWTVLDKDTKLIPSFLVGKRSADNARRLMMDLANRMVIPKPHEADDHAYEKGSYRQITQISTDGFAGYPEAVDLAFGVYAKHGVIIKEYKNARMQYDPSEMVGTKRVVKKGNISPWSIVTSHIERHNLTIRTFMKRFTRARPWFLKEVGEPRSRCRDVHRLLQFRVRPAIPTTVASVASYAPQQR